MPDVPTVAELGYKDFEANTWIAVFAPARTPSAVLDLLNAEINRAVATRSVQERFATLALEAAPMDRAQLRAYVEAEVTKWGKLVKTLNIKAE